MKDDEAEAIAKEAMAAHLKWIAEREARWRTFQDANLHLFELADLPVQCWDSCDRWGSFLYEGAVVVDVEEAIAVDLASKPRVAQEALFALADQWLAGESKWNYPIWNDLWTMLNKGEQQFKDYVQVLARASQQLLGREDDWWNELREDFEVFRAYFFGTSPAYTFVVDGLLRDYEFDMNVQADFDWGWELVDALDDAEAGFVFGAENYDWKAARARLGPILAVRGLTLEPLR